MKKLSYNSLLIAWIQSTLQLSELSKSFHKDGNYAFQTANSVGILEEIQCHQQITDRKSLDGDDGSFLLFSARILQMASESFKNPDRIPVGRVAGFT